jgi:hypothetical protein
MVRGQVNLNLGVLVGGLQRLGDGADAVAAGHVLDFESNHCLFQWVVDVSTVNSPTVVRSRARSGKPHRRQADSSLGLDLAIVRTLTMPTSNNSRGIHEHRRTFRIQAAGHGHDMCLLRHACREVAQGSPRRQAGQRQPGDRTGLGECRARSDCRHAGRCRAQGRLRRHDDRDHAAGRRHDLRLVRGARREGAAQGARRFRGDGQSRDRERRASRRCRRCRSLR